ncbi:hypothetical protein BV22DRAFT_218921 [Leucogyrophana mollusca]|uniref:Uncharacterized protein n=1 Tax=Leucogyrophana mollusca TaxID=85980 RepID=A0ACB8BS57_9AGAM|nr:hypothetical protein BV22DRAFT_218921 [Leucogyrophana mollusca]
MKLLANMPQQPPRTTFTELIRPGIHMIPKFANPHFLVQATEPVSRATLYGDEGVDEHGIDENETKSLKRKLEDILQSVLGDSVATTSSRPKKRQRGAEQIEGTPENTALFRLLSASRQPQLISLEPPPPPPSKTRAPDLEDSPSDADQRQMRAKSVAVDFAWLMTQTQPTHKPNPKSSRKLSHATCASLVPPPVIMVTVEPRPPPKTRPPGLLSENRHTQSPPNHTQDPQTRYPVMRITTQSSSSPSYDSTRKKRKKRTRERPPAAFWRPDATVQQGKALGYALGYPGSWSARYEGDPRKRWYVRDTMRKGVLAT